jgi:heme/copper-type cytochrome/quinol oxidase subunit 2
LWYSWNDSEEDDREFCETILWWDYRVDIVQTEAPLIVRIAKFFLRITMVLAVTMVIFNGIMWIIESAKWAEVKDAKKNITLIIVWILIALMSLGIINLISSLTVSSLWNNSSTETIDIIDDNLWPNPNL